MSDVTGKGADGGKRKNRHGKDLPIGSQVRVSRLNTLPHIFAEKSRVYRECRQREGKYPLAIVGARLTGMLNELSSQMLLEEQLAQLAQEVADLRALVTTQHAREGRSYVPGSESGVKSIAARAESTADDSAVSLNGRNSHAEHEPRRG